VTSQLTKVLGIRQNYLCDFHPQKNVTVQQQKGIELELEPFGMSRCEVVKLPPPWFELL
jgi:hypothetical protein